MDYRVYRFKNVKKCPPLKKRCYRVILQCSMYRVVKTEELIFNIYKATELIHNLRGGKYLSICNG